MGRGLPDLGWGRVFSAVIRDCANRAIGVSGCNRICRDHGCGQSHHGTTHPTSPTSACITIDRDKNTLPNIYKPNLFNSIAGPLSLSLRVSQTPAVQSQSEFLSDGIKEDLTK